MLNQTKIWRILSHQKALILIFLASFYVSFFPSFFSTNAQLPTSEIRGVWLTNIDSDVLFSKENTKNAIKTLAEFNFNSLYPTVWNWGYTLYPSQVNKKVIGVEMSPEKGLQNRDVLQEIITETHNQKMAVIPWFEFGFMAPKDSELAKLHPEWLTRRLNGDRVWLEGNTHERVWLNPLYPEVQKFISDLVLEIVTKYDIDGIQFDDHFGYPSDFGYDNYTVHLYQQEHDGNYPPINPKNPEWIQWRADKITDYMGVLFHQIKAVKKDVIVSISPNPQGFSKESFLLDWETWERKGFIEELIVQIYRNNMTSFTAELEKSEIQNANQHIPVAIAILAGLKGLSVDINLIKQQVDLTRQKGFAGVSFFFYESLWNFDKDTINERKLAYKSFFSSPLKRSTIIN